MKKCLNISEEVVLPEIYEIEEHLVMDPPVQCEETVNIPAIVQEPNEVEQAIDPAWREYVYNVEDKFVNAIITEYPNMPTILVIGHSNNNSGLRHYIGEELVTLSY